MERELMSRIVNPAISIVGAVSGPAKIDALTQPGNKAGDKSGANNKINISGLLKEKEGNNEQSQDTGERAIAEDTTDKSKTSIGGESIQDRLNKDPAISTSKSRFDQMIEDAKNKEHQPPQFPDSSMMGQQNQGIDPAMMAAMMGKGQQGGGQQGGGGSPKQSQPSSGSGQVKDQMQKMSDKFTEALKNRDAKIEELAKKVKESKDPRQSRPSTDPLERTERGGLGSDSNQLAKYESLIDKMSSKTATDTEKAAAKQEMLAMTNKNLFDQTSQGAKTQIKEEFGNALEFNTAVREAKQESKRNENSIAEYDTDSFAVTDLIQRDSDIFASSRVEDNNELDIAFDDEEIEMPDLDLDIEIDID